MKSYLCTLVLVTNKNNAKRGVAFLVLDDNRVTAKDAFDNFPIKTERQFRTWFDVWLEGKINPKRYHGWDKSGFGGKYTNCFVFKCKENKKQRRLYGFLCNPNTFNKSYQICILICHAFKNEHETDKNDLETVEETRALPIVQKAIKDFFMEATNATVPLDRTKH